MTLNNLFLSQGDIRISDLHSVDEILSDEDRFIDYKEQAAAYESVHSEVGIPSNLVYIHTVETVYFYNSYFYFDKEKALLFNLPFMFDGAKIFSFGKDLCLDSQTIIAEHEQHMKNGDWEWLIATSPEHLQLQYIQYCLDRIPETELYDLFFDWYAIDDYSSRNVTIEEIRRAGAARSESKTAALRKKLDELSPSSDYIWAYRGQGDKSTQMECAYSWTTDLNVAVFFAARRSNSHAEVYKALIPKSGIIAYIADRGESELVVDPEQITNVETIISMPGADNEVLCDTVTGLLDTWAAYIELMKQVCFILGRTPEEGQHDMNHMGRVLLYALILAEEYLPDSPENEDLRKALFTACVTHDIGRTNDMEDDEHGAESYKLLAGTKLVTGRILRLLMKYHCKKDTEAVELMKDVKNYTAFCILKDADALDRVRFELRDLDVNQLRLEKSRSLVLFARQSVESIKIN